MSSSYGIFRTQSKISPRYGDTTHQKAACENKDEMILYGEKPIYKATEI